METFTARLRKIIEDSGMPQGRFAATAGIRAPALSNYLSGAREPTSEALFKLAEAGGVSAQWLLTGEGNRQNYVAKLAEAARKASEVKDQVDPEQVIFDLLIERQRTERLEAELTMVTKRLEKLQSFVEKILADAGTTLQEIKS